MRQFTRSEIHKDSLASLLLFLAVALAFIISNNDLLLLYYRKLINLELIIGFGPFVFDKTLLKFVNDGLMAIFFFFLGLEMKYHITEGEFKERRKLLFPTITAIGGFIIPASLYTLFNYDFQEGKIGWAIPVATDTAFVLAIINLMKNKVSNSVRVFVIGWSIIDDVLAILVLAIFYTPNLAPLQLLLCSIPLTFLATLNLRKSFNRHLYYLGGIVLWIFVVKSGVHGTIAGIIVAFFIPTNISIFNKTVNLVKEVSSSVHSLVAFLILPLFAFVNCELPFKELSLEEAFSPISIGCFVGLVVGKPLGICSAMIIAGLWRKIELPQGTNKIQLLGIACLGGIGFTLSLFIGLLAFDSAELENQMKIGVLLASFCSALIGALIIKIF